MTLTVMICGFIILAVFPILFIWLYQRQQIKELDRAMAYLSHTAIQHHKEVKATVSSQPYVQTEFQKMPLKKASNE